MAFEAALHSQRPSRVGPAVALACCLSLGALAIFSSAVAQTAATPPQVAASTAAQPSAAASSAASGKRAAPGKPHASAAKNGAKAPIRPLWAELTVPQRQALAPLAPKWNSMSDAQKRKWLALSQNFPRMSTDEQAKLHSRMTEWTALSASQRTQARLNFGEAQQLSPNDKKAKWEAYQALPPEEKRKLAAGAAKPPPTAAAVKPVHTPKLASVPAQEPAHLLKSPRIAAGANQVDPNTLLPQAAPASPAGN